MTKRTILVVEDERKTADTLRLYLESAGFDVALEHDGRAGLATARRINPALVVLDLMLPGIDGLAICKSLRAERETPVLMLTARAAEADRLRGLELGADDYVVKPFSPREVVARVRAILRRVDQERSVDAGRRHAVPTKSATVRAGALVVDVAEHVARVGDREFRLPPAEFKVLATFARRPGRVFTREELARAAFGDDWAADARTIDVHVSRLRRRLARDEPGPRSPRGPLIETLHGIGYRLKVVRDGA